MNLIKRISMMKIIFASLELILGIFLICLPNTALLTLCYMLGAVILASGIFYIVADFKNFVSLSFIRGVVQILVGLIFILLANLIINASILPILVGVVLILFAFLQLQKVLNPTFNTLSRVLFGVYGALLITSAVILFCNPFSAQQTMIVFFGVILIINAICKVATTISMNFKFKEFEKYLMDNELPKDAKQSQNKISENDEESDEVIIETTDFVVKEEKKD